MNDLIYEETLLEYDGPLIAVYRDSLGCPYILFWVDNTETQNVWLILKINQEALDLFSGGSVGFNWILESFGHDADYIDIDSVGKWSNRRKVSQFEVINFISVEDFYL